MSKRSGRPRALAASLPAAARRALRQEGLADGAVVTAWPDIVGPALSAHSLPRRLRFPGRGRSDGTLEVLVSGSMALELQHLAHQIIERVNGHFGYAAVARLRIVQGPLLARPPAPRRPRDRASRPAGPPATGPPPDLDTVADEGLRAALARLGRAVASSDRDSGEE